MTTQAQEITLVRAIHASPSQVYKAFTTAQGWRDWCCETAEADASIGGRLHIYTEGYHAYGEYMQLEQDRAVAFTWNGDGEPPMRIQVLIDAQDNSASLTFKVTGLGSEGDWTSIADFLERTWGRVLNNLKAVLET